MRIAEILLQSTIGGAETLVEALSASWNSDGHEMKTIYVDGPQFRTSPVSRARRMRQELDDFKPDVVHSHSAIPNLYARVAARNKWPVVTVLHSAGNDFDDRRLRLAENRLKRWTKAVIAVSPALRDEYQSAFGNSPQVHFIANGLRPGISRKIAVTTKPHRALALGRIAEQKRPDLLIKAWTASAPDGWHLDLVGSAKDAALMRELSLLASEASRAGAPVNFPGESANVGEVLRDYDLLIHASERESQGLAPLEAAAAGVPIIVSDQVFEAMGVPELPATLFENGNEDSLRAAINSSLDNYQTVATAALHSASVVVQKTSMVECAARHFEVLRNAVR